ncbi:MAG TPA: transcription antiterminator BglG [Propionibacteriaceae bacterium]|nr:transcription antiterminator BglG [Propionibacteriaceae bacterium]
MELLRVFNNNVVLAADATGAEVILTGRGLGFQARPGDPVDLDKVVRVFVPVDGRDPDHLAQLLAAIPPEHVALVTEAIDASGQTMLLDNPALIIALADHVSFAIKRQRAGIALEYPLRAEVRHLYAEEYRQAVALLAAINAHSETPLPDAEAVALTLHLVNASFATGDLSYTYTMTGLIGQMLVVIEESFGISLPEDSISAGRFITHLRYLFVRIRQHNQLSDEHSEIGVAIRAAYPRAAECAARLGALLELRLSSALTDDEISYLALHVARVVNDPA